MIIKSNLVKFVKENFNVTKFSFKKMYSYGKGRNKYTYYKVNVDGVEKEIEFYDEDISSRDMIDKIVNKFNLEKHNNLSFNFSTSQLNNFAREFSRLPIDTDELITVVAKKAYDENFFNGKGYSNIKVVDDFVKLLENFIQTKTMTNEVFNALKNININLVGDFYDKELVRFAKIIHKYFKTVTSKSDWRTILVTASRLHEVTSDTRYAGSNFGTYIGKAIKTVKKQNLTAEDDFKFYISTEDHSSWTQDGCCGFSSISHSEWNETCYLVVNWNEIEVYSFRNGSAYGHY